MIRVILALIGLLFVPSVMAQGSLDAKSRKSQSQTTLQSPINYSEVQRHLDRASTEPWTLRTLRKLRNPMGDYAEVFNNLKLNSVLGFGYTAETGFLINGVLSGVYHVDKDNSEQLPSSLSLSAQVSVKRFFQIRLDGQNHFGSNRRILSYEASYGILPILFWGLGYDAADVNPKSKYSRRAFDANVKLLNRVISNLYAGGAVDIRYNKAASMEELAESYIFQHGVYHRSAFTVGLGLIAQYDNRDNRYSTTSGWFLSLLTEIRPKGLGDCGDTLWHIKATADYFTPLWESGVLGVDLYADLWSSATPWFMWPCVGGGSRMRGYYFGRYTDRKMATAQVELRQHIYGPLGCAVWGGAGSVVDSHKNIDFKKILPNYGLGVRIDLGRNSRLRIDYGFGRHSNGVVVGMNEAF